MSALKVDIDNAVAAAQAKQISDWNGVRSSIRQGIAQAFTSADLNSISNAFGSNARGMPHFVIEVNMRRYKIEANADPTLCVLTYEPKSYPGASTQTQKVLAWSDLRQVIIDNEVSWVTP